MRHARETLRTRAALESGNARGRLRARSAVLLPHLRRPRSVAARRIIVPHSRRIGHSHAIGGRNPRDCLHVCASRAFFYSDHRPRPTRRAVRTSRYITERSGGTRPTIIGVRHASFSPLLLAPPPPAPPAPIRAATSRRRRRRRRRRSVLLASRFNRHVPRSGIGATPRRDTQKSY